MEEETGAEVNGPTSQHGANTPGLISRVHSTEGVGSMATY